MAIFPWVLQLAVTTAVAQDAITNCDKYAASHLDPQRKAVGVHFENLNLPLAVPACEDAARQYPNNIRFAYQLGRVYEKAGKLTVAKPTSFGKPLIDNKEAPAVEAGASAGARTKRLRRAQR